jgi:hypothetical protein
MNTYYEGTQYEIDTLGYEDNTGYWIYLLGDTVTVYTSVDKTPLWKETYRENERRDEIHAIKAWKTLCRGLKNSDLSLRTLLDMYCRDPFGKAPITDDEWPEEAEKHDANRLA